MSSAWGKKYPEKMAACRANWLAANPDKRKKCVNNWVNSGSKKAIQYKIRRTTRQCIWRALHGIGSPERAEKLLGCSIPKFKAHIESLFKPGMTWENNTRDGWHIDHKKPCSSFDLTKLKQRKLCYHYTNTQPLWAVDNQEKSNKYDIQ